MVYNNKTSHIITGNFRWSDARYIRIRAFLHCQIRKTATQSRMESYLLRTEKSHLYKHVSVSVSVSECILNWTTPYIHLFISLLRFTAIAAWY